MWVMNREEAISIIGGLYPIDSQYQETSAIGRRLLQQAKEEVDNWRNEPTEVLLRYAELCQEQENKTIRNMNRRIMGGGE